MSGGNRHYPMPMEQHPSESLPDETIPNDAPQVPSPEEHRRAIQDARVRGTPVDSLPWPNASQQASHPAPLEQSPAESLPDEAIPNDAPPFHGSSTEGGNVSNGLSTWPSSTHTSSANLSASSSAGHGTERPRLAPLTTIHGNDPSQGELMRSPGSVATTEMPPPPYTRGQSSQAQTAVAADPVSANSGEFSPPQHNYPGLPPGVSPASGASVSGGSGSQDALIHGAMQDASSRAISGSSEPSEPVALPKYSNRPQDGNRRIEQNADGSYKMFPADDPNAAVAMRNLGSDSTSEPGASSAAAGGAMVQHDGGEAQKELEPEQSTRNPLRRFWRRHFKGPHNKRKRAWLISLIIFIIVFLIILLAVLGAKKKLAGQGGGDDDDSDSDDDDDDDDDEDDE